MQSRRLVCGPGATCSQFCAHNLPANPRHPYTDANDCKTAATACATLQRAADAAAADAAGSGGNYKVSFVGVPTSAPQWRLDAPVALDGAVGAAGCAKGGAWLNVEIDGRQPGGAVLEVSVAASGGGAPAFRVAGCNQLLLTGLKLTAEPPSSDAGRRRLVEARADARGAPLVALTRVDAAGFKAPRGGGGGGGDGGADGGAVLCDGCTLLALMTTRLSGCEAGQGGGGGGSGGGGGAIAALATTSVRVEASVLQGNKAPAGDGGAILVRDADNVWLSTTALLDNEAAGAGGALHVKSTSGRALGRVASNCLFDGNRAGGAGGGAAVDGASGAGFVFTTFYNNEAFVGGDNAATASGHAVDALGSGAAASLFASIAWADASAPPREQLGPRVTAAFSDIQRGAAAAGGGGSARAPAPAPPLPGAGNIASDPRLTARAAVVASPPPDPRLPQELSPGQYSTVVRLPRVGSPVIDAVDSFMTRQQRDAPSSRGGAGGGAAAAAGMAGNLEALSHVASAAGRAAGGAGGAGDGTAAECLDGADQRGFCRLAGQRYDMGSVEFAPPRVERALAYRAATASRALSIPAECIARALNFADAAAAPAAVSLELLPAGLGSEGVDGGDDAGAGAGGGLGKAGGLGGGGMARVVRDGRGAEALALEPEMLAALAASRAPGLAVRACAAGAGGGACSERVGVTVAVGARRCLSGGVAVCAALPCL